MRNICRIANIIVTKKILVKKTRMNGTRRRSEEFQLTWDKVFQRDFDFVYLHQFD